MVEPLSKETIKARFATLQRREQQKLKQAYEIMSPHARHIIDLLPLLIHLNHPLIPGFRQGLVPHGIDNFKLTKNQQNFINSLCNNESFDLEVQEHDIMALYAMGSTSSIGQGFSSDFDIWVCVKSNISIERLALLQDKCSFLSVFAKSQGVDLNLFVTEENRFTECYHDTMDAENCGSAQNLFLLDEFYRSAIRLSGRYLIWYLINTKEEKSNYAFYKEEIKRSGILSTDEWFDFGTVLNSSPTEYFGSGLWLLYKGIESPFKATIKILLMEVYANEYPHTSLLSSELKDRLLDDERGQLVLDSYFAMFKKVADYLTDRHDDKRLDLMRLAFYLKIYKGLKGINNSQILNYRLSLLQNLAKSFSWDNKKVHFLEACDRWKIPFIRDLNKRLLNSLIESYRELLRFSIKHGIEYAITSDDASMLSRRLYAAYDKYPGKILVFNNELSASLEEKNLTFIFPHAHTLCRKSWHLYPCASDDIAIISLPLAYNASSICEVIAWACFNRLLSPRTNIEVLGDYGLVRPSNIKALSRDIMRLLPFEAIESKTTEMQKPRSISRCLIILNFENDPTVENTVINNDFEIGYSLSFGRQKICLIGSIDLITINNWGELLSISMPYGEEGVVELLAMLVRFTSINNVEDALKIVSVVSHARNYKEILRFDLELLIKQVFTCRLMEQEINFDVAKNTYHASNSSDRGLQITRLNSFGYERHDVSILSRFGMRTEFALQVPAIVDRYATIGIIQYFFAPTANGSWDIYVLNERNEVRIQHDYSGSRAKLVNSINRFYSKLAEEESGGRLHFNLPQYFVVSEDLTSIHPFTIKA